MLFVKVYIAVVMILCRSSLLSVSNCLRGLLMIFVRMKIFCNCSVDSAQFLCDAVTVCDI